MRTVAVALALIAAQFSSGVSLVEVYVSVTDSTGNPVRGLPRDAFEVYEDGEKQTIGTFVAGEFPLSVAIALDRSASMAGERLTLARAAAHQFVSELRTDDNVMLLGVGSELEVLTPLTSDHAAVRRAIDRLDAWGTTALYDALVAAVDQLAEAKGRRALLVLSDGVDRYSKATASDALSFVRRNDVLVYPVALAKNRPPLFAELAATSGGRSFHLRDPKALPETFKRVAAELRHQYLIGYAPARPMNPQAPEWRAIRVNVAREGVVVRARDGYFAR